VHIEKWPAEALPAAFKRKLLAAKDLDRAVRRASDEELEALVDLVIEHLDQGRFDNQGGYPSDWNILEDGRLVMATVDHNDGPRLVIAPVADFIIDHIWCVEGLVEGWQEERAHVAVAAKPRRAIRLRAPLPPSEPTPDGQL
jgi:hypothetical protein